MKRNQDQDFKRIVSIINKVTDFNLDHYKIKPLRRRIHSRMRRLGIDNYKDYTNYLATNKDEVTILEEALTINLTRFFRNKAVFEYIKDEILPSLNNPSIWSAGCASGAEPFTLAILCHEQNLNCSIVGTDIDTESIKKAREGIYDIFSMKEVEPDIQKKYFKKVGKNYKIIDKIKERVKFQQLDLKDISFESGFDLIICRNVLIYLSREFQEQTLLCFHKALKPGGYLILGKVESLVGQAKELFNPLNLKNRIYDKR